MEKVLSHDQEMLRSDFDQEIKALLSIMAEICVHNFLEQQSVEEKKDD